MFWAGFQESEAPADPSRELPVSVGFGESFAFSKVGNVSLVRSLVVGRCEALRCHYRFLNPMLASW